MEEQPKKKRKAGRPPWTPEQKAAARERWAKRKAAESMTEQQQMELYNQYRAQKEVDPENTPSPYEWGKMMSGDDGDRKNARLLHEARVSMSLPKIDTSDPEQVRQRVNDYFDFCETHNKRPQMVGLANWLDIDKNTLSAWKAGIIKRTDIAPIISRAMAILEEYMVDQMQDSKTNPANWIFLLKNMFQYRDQQDVVVSPNTDNTRDMSQDELEKWFLEDGNHFETSFKEDNP